MRLLANLFFLMSNVRSTRKDWINREVTSRIWLSSSLFPTDIRSFTKRSVCLRGLCDRQLKRDDSARLSWQMYTVWIAQVQNKDDGKCHARYYTAVDTIQFTWMVGNRVCEWRRMSFPPRLVRTSVGDEGGWLWNEAVRLLDTLKLCYEFWHIVIGTEVVNIFLHSIFTHLLGWYSIFIQLVVRISIVLIFVYTFLKCQFLNMIA